MIKSQKSEQLIGFTTVAKKFVMALSGLGLVAFVAIHLIENLLLYRSEGSAFNSYVHLLHSVGGLLIVAELGLLAVFLAHILTGVSVTMTNKSARPQRYRVWRSKGGATPSNASSRNMIISGMILLVFLVVHIWQFRFGPGVEQGYTTQIDGHEALDLYRLVVETFKNPVYAGFYMFCMILLGMHIRHGFWSLFQSLGAVSGQPSRRLLGVSAGLGFVLAVGFLFIPVWIYFFV